MAAKVRVDYSVQTTVRAPRILVHSASNYVGDIEKAMIAVGIDPATVIDIDPIRSFDAAL